MKNKGTNILIFILLLAGLLRFSGIEHGFPFIFHPDEPTIIRSALELRFKPNPGHFDWPHFYIYLNYFIYMGFAYVRNIISSNQIIKNFFMSKSPLIFNDELIFYFITRVFTALLGTLTVIPVYLTGKKLFNYKIGILAGLTFAIMPFHVLHSHYALPDVPMAFFAAWGIYFSSKILEKEEIGSYSVAGLFAGLSASTKYNGGFTAITVPIAHILRIITSFFKEKYDREPIISVYGLVSLVASGLFAIIGFVVGTPFSVLDYATFTRTDGPSGALWQFRNVGTVTFNLWFEHLLHQFVAVLPDDLGFTILVGYIICFGFLFYRLFKRNYSRFESSLIFLFLPSLFLLVYLSGFEKSRSHYYLAAYPYIAILFAYFLDELFTYILKNFKNLSFIVLLLLIPPFLISVKNTAMFIRNDTRVDLSTWVVSNLNKTDHVVYDGAKLPGLLQGVIDNPQNSEDSLISYSQGYFISDNPGSSSTNAALNRFKKYNVITTFSNYLRLGPEITVYKYEL